MCRIIYGRIVAIVAAICMLTVLPGTVLADFIGVSDGNTVTATAGGYFDGGVPPVKMVDGSGMSDATVVKTSTANNNGASNWFDGAPTADEKWVLFTFANTTTLGEMVIWNANIVGGGYNYSSMGLKDVVITYSTGANATGTGNPFFTGQLHEATGSATQGYTDDLYAVISASDVKAVKVVYSSKWWETGDEAWVLDEDLYGLSEVRFDATPVVPEPSTLTLLASGLAGLLCYAWRKRR